MKALLRRGTFFPFRRKVILPSQRFRAFGVSDVLPTVVYVRLPLLCPILSFLFWVSFVGLSSRVGRFSDFFRDSYFPTFYLLVSPPFPFYKRNPLSTSPPLLQVFFRFILQASRFCNFSFLFFTSSYVPFF